MIFFHENKKKKEKKGEVANPTHLCFFSCFLEWTKLLFPGSSVYDNNDALILVISLISIAILFSVIASSQINYVKPVACKKASKNNFALSSASDLKPENPLVQKSKTRKMNEFSKETVFFFTFCSTGLVVFSFLFLNLAQQEFYFSQLVYIHNQSDWMLNVLIMRCAVRFAMVLCKVVLCSTPVSLTPGSL